MIVWSVDSKKSVNVLKSVITLLLRTMNRRLEKSSNATKRIFRWCRMRLPTKSDNLASISPSWNMKTQCANNRSTLLRLTWLKLRKH